MQHVLNAGIKIIYCRIDQGHDQNLLVFTNFAFGDKAERQHREGGGFAAAWNCGNSHFSGLVSNNRCLGRTRIKHFSPPGTGRYGG